MTGIYLRNKIDDIKNRLCRGLIDYDQAKKEAQPIIDEMNRLGSVLMKKRIQFLYWMLACRFMEALKVYLKHKGL